MFNLEVAIVLDFYVYRLIDPRNGETFYIGKGKNNRVFEHAKGQQSSGDGLSDKESRIYEIKAAGFEVQHVIHRHGMDSDTAFEVEAALMDAYPSVTNIMGGHGNSERGIAHANEITERYAAPNAEIVDPIIEININLHGSLMSLYSTTRAAWKLSLNSAEKARYALAVNKGIVVEVFLIDKWLQANRENFPELLENDIPGRFGFVGQVAPDEVREKYIRHRMPPKPKGAANPIRYFNL